MSYTPSKKQEEGWTTVLPKLHRAAFEQKTDDAPKAKKYVPPVKRNPDQKAEPATFDEAFPELKVSKSTNDTAKNNLWTSKTAVDVVKGIKNTNNNEPKLNNGTPVVSSLEGVMKYRENTPKTTTIRWEFSKTAYSSMEPHWVAARNKVFEYVTTYGDDIRPPLSVRVVDISGQNEEEFETPAYIPGLYAKLRAVRERSRIRKMAEEKARNRFLFDNHTEESESYVHAEDEPDNEFYDSQEETASFDATDED